MLINSPKFQKQKIVELMTYKSIINTPRNVLFSLCEHDPEHSDLYLRLCITQMISLIGLNFKASYISDN